MFDSNRRKNPRANYPCQLTIWFVDGSYETILANISNIGIGGLCVHLHHGVELATKIDIKIDFTGTTTPFKCQGTVIRSVKENDRFYNIGIKFEPLNDLKQAYIEAKIAELIELEKKVNK